MNNKLRVGVIFGGRSGEHEVSLMSARSVLRALDPGKYQVTEIGVTHEGAWLVGENVLDSFVAGKFDHLTPVTMLPDPTRHGIYAILLAMEYMLSMRPKEGKPSSIFKTSMCSFPCCTAPSAKMAPYRGCSRWPM
ncbi:MAG: hypothetical protein FJ010_04860 [Chloroflexi bacterium]|nr:hypothetical protein [Chloroflexota bacterium]